MRPNEIGPRKLDGFIGRRVPRKGLIYFLGFICAIFWGVGTQFVDARIAPYWYLANGVSVGEVLFFFVLLLTLFDTVWRVRFQLALYQMKGFAISLYLLTTILLTSVAVNTPLYGGELNDAFACLRLIYFLLIAVFVHAYIIQYSALSILIPFILGLALIAIDQLVYAFTSPTAVLLTGGLPMVKDPNVAGAVFGYGILFCSLALLRGGRNVYLFVAFFFAIASAFTFSKGAWIMVILGGVACFVAVKIREGSSAKVTKAKAFLGLFVVAMMLTYIIYSNYDALESAFIFKLETTEDNASVGDRFNLALVGLYAMIEHPLLGLGYRNYDVIGNQNLDLIIQNSGNANNAFLQIGAVGGVGSFVLIVWLFVYPFRQLSQILPLNALGKVYFGAAFLIMFIFAVVQIQLIAQPVFWVFIGLISGWKSHLQRYRTICGEPHINLKNSVEPSGHT